MEPLGALDFLGFLNMAGSEVFLDLNRGVCSELIQLDTPIRKQTDPVGYLCANVR